MLDLWFCQIKIFLFLGAVTIGILRQHRPVIRCIFSFLKKKEKGCRYYRG
jgi:hypothetical protein